MDLTSQLRGLYAPGVAYEIATPERPIPEMVLEVASRYPGRAAIDFFARQLTYAELAEDMLRWSTPSGRGPTRRPGCPRHAALPAARHRCPGHNAPGRCRRRT